MNDAASSKAKAIPINVDGLYEKHRTVYARSVSGIFSNWRWAMVVLTQALFYGLCWDRMERTAGGPVSHR
jgi:hypothetical protein